MQPKADAVVNDLYNTGGDANSNASGTSESDPTTFLKESDAPKIKTIFWAFNITNFAPELNIHADVNCASESVDSSSCKLPACRSWHMVRQDLHMDSGESTVAA